MPYSVVFSDRAFRELKKLDRTVQERIIGVLERVRIRPERYLVKLVGDPGYKIRAGDYRIIVDIDHENMEIQVLKVGHRRSIYG